MNLCKKVPGKKFLEKNLEIKNLEKSPNFLKSLEKMSLEIKSCVLIPGTFLVGNFRTFFWKLFSKDLLAVTIMNNIVSLDVLLQPSCANEMYQIKILNQWLKP